MLHGELRQACDLRHAVQACLPHHERVLGVKVPPPGQLERAVLVDDFPVGEIAALPGREVPRGGVPVEHQRDFFFCRNAREHRKQYGIPVFGHDDVRVAAREVAVERSDHLRRLIVFQRVRAAVVADLQLVGLPVLRRDEVGDIFQRHRHQRGEPVFQGAGIIVEIPGNQPSFFIERVLAEGQREEPGPVEIELPGGDVGIEEDEMREVRLETADDVLQVKRIVHGDAENVPFLVCVDLPPHRPVKADAERKETHDRRDARLVGLRDVHVEPRVESGVAAVLCPVTVHQPERDPLPRRIEVKQPPGDRPCLRHAPLPVVSPGARGLRLSCAAPGACTWRCFQRGSAWRHRRSPPAGAAPRGRARQALPGLPCATRAGIFPSFPFPAG